MIAKIATFIFKKETLDILFVLVLSTKEKEDLVIDLLKKGYNVRTIAKSAHASFTDIGKIRKKITGEVMEEEDKEEKTAKPLSITSQSFKLFLEGKSLVDVATILDISKDEVIHNYCDYLILKNMKEVVEILKEYRNNLAAFVKLFNYLKNNKIKWNDIKNVINNTINLKIIEQQKEKLEKEIESILEERDYLLKNLEDIKTTYY